MGYQARKFIAFLLFSLFGRLLVRIAVLLRLVSLGPPVDYQIKTDVLDKYSKIVAFSSSVSNLGHGDMDCSICFSSYVEGDSIRKLHCGHHFHRDCVDPWLLGKQCSCPVCLCEVVPLGLQSW